MCRLPKAAVHWHSEAGREDWTLLMDLPDLMQGLGLEGSRARIPAGLSLAANVCSASCPQWPKRRAESNLQEVPIGSP